MKNFTNNNFKIITGTTIVLLGFLFDTNLVVKANTCQENPDTFPSSCMKTPVIYKTRIYELGLCTDDPLSGTTGSGNNITSDYEIDLAAILEKLVYLGGSDLHLKVDQSPMVL